MRVRRIIVSRVRIRAHKNDHAKFAAACDKFAEHIAITQPLAAMMKGNFRRIKRYASAAAQADSVGFRALEIIEPEVQIEFCGIVFDKGELRPTHWLVHPGRSSRGKSLSASKQPR